MYIQRIRTVAAMWAITALAGAAYLPLESTNPPLPATGCALVSVWVRPTQPSLHNAQATLTIRETDNNYRAVGFTRLATGHWSKLSAWLYPITGASPRESLLLGISSTSAVEVTSLDVQVPGQARGAFEKGFVRVAGRQLTNNHGALVLRGVNITAYSDDPSDEAGEMLAMIVPRDYEQIAACGFNAVRLTCWYDALQKAGGWEWLDVQIALARRYGLYLVLDMHAPPGGYQGSNYAGTFWSSTTMQNNLEAWWRGVAQHYSNEPAIAAYDLINEPLPHSPAQWYAYAQRLVNAIRAEGDAHAIVVETDIDSGDLWTRINDPAIIYDTHWYEPWDFVAQSASSPFGAYGGQVTLWGEPITLDKAWLRETMREYVQWCASNGVPMQFGEYGIGTYAEAQQNGLGWLRDTCDLLDEIPASRFYWSWYPFEFGLNVGWYRRDPGEFRADAAEIAAGMPEPCVASVMTLMWCAVRRLRTTARSDATVSGKRRLFGLSFRGARSDSAPVPEPGLGGALLPLLLLCRAARQCALYRRRESVRPAWHPARCR